MMKLQPALLAVILLAWGCTPRPMAPASGKTGVAAIDFRDVITDSKTKVFPTVVFIKCLQQTHDSGEKSTREVGGSGVIISAEGEVLTNWHVVDKAVEVRCLLFDGRALKATVVGTDKDTDLALLKLDRPAGSPPLPFAVLGDSARLKEGDFVMAMGAPWGMSRSVSIGIISCTCRFLPEHSEYSLWLQTDASISPGNSGGPLVNTHGEVIGINTLGGSTGGDIGFAIPSITVKEVARQLRESGHVNWSWTGLQLQPLKDFERNIYFDANDGVIVAETDPESPARRAGVQSRDRIVKIGGRSVTAVTEEDLPKIRQALGLLPKGQEVQIELMRQNQPLTVTLTPREKGRVEGEELDCPRWDFTAKTINQFDNPDLYYYRQQGVFIYGVKYPGNASSARLQTNDIIVNIDGREITSLDQVEELHKAALEKIDTKHRVLLSVLRGGLLRQIALDFARDYQKE